MAIKIIKKYRSIPQTVKASIWFLVCSFLQKGISVITTPIFTRLLSTSEYGQYNVFDSWLRITTVFVSLQLYLGVFTQGLVKFSDDKKKFASSLQGLTLVLIAFWTIIYALFFRFWNHLFNLSTIQVLAMLLMIWATACFNFWAAEQRVEYRYRALVIITLVVSFAKPALGIVLVSVSTDKVTARIIGLVIVELIGYSAFFAIQLARGKCFFSKKYWRYALAFNVPLIPHYLSQQVLSSSDRIMIENMIGSDEAGIYSLAYSISQIMILVNTAISHTLTPWIYQKIKSNKIVEIPKVVYMAMVGIALSNLAVIAVSPEVVAIFAPSSYRNAIWVIPPVAMSVLLLFSYDMFAKFEFYFEKTKLIMTASVIGAVLNIILNYFFINLFGYYAAGYTTLFCYAIYVLFH